MEQPQRAGGGGRAESRRDWLQPGRLAGCVVRILHGKSINKGYTFNGAGVGDVLPGYELVGIQVRISEV